MIFVFVYIQVERSKVIILERVNVLNEFIDTFDLDKKQKKKKKNTSARSELYKIGINQYVLAKQAE